MANKAEKTEHTGAKHGSGAYWGPKKEAKKESNKVRRRNWKKETDERADEGTPVPVSTAGMSFDASEDIIRKIAPTPPAYKAIREDAKRKGTDKLTMAQINREVAAVRRQHDRKTTKYTGK